jgi:16S rRNA (uracil1498-N3)-methyltransferase
MTPRLYINAPLSEGNAAPLSAEQAHYLKNVLRRKEGETIRLFNGRDGEFDGEIAELKKKGGLAAIKKQTRAQDVEPDLVFCFAPVKRGPLEIIVQKATEIGAARLCPVITQRTVAAKLNIERLQAIVTEAAEQCGRMTVPSVDEPVKFEAMLKDWTPSRRIMFCDEAGDSEHEQWGGKDGRAAPALEALKSGDSKTESWAVLTGPEGGFTPEERALLRAKNYVTPVTLGPRILRADTAAIAALVLWQAAIGDWRKN